ncbi:glucokinase [Synechococcales cyanobacterium C]|uniref:Glucokinase n=1 Tax=Petrachloros mirabilis ULC683 TaxID=2781853 RepID=A0A8K2A7P0_9CYAN|nr:glucokinase [Petrachloros mirabilis]NCJ06399.1 glucokinase [Petrachloros mirabilis ULC683]
MTRIIAGDIGGTKTLLRLEQKTGSERQTLGESLYVSANYAHLNDIVADFLHQVGGERPQAACFAIAGPVVSGTSQLTNLSWYLEEHQMSKALEIPQVRLINDFAAVGYGILALQPEDQVILQDQPRVAKAPIAVIGAGTGLGQALLIWQGQDYDVLAIEGGHSDYAPRTDLEIGLLQYLRRRHHRVSVERVVSGQGIYAIYEYLRDTQVAPESADIKARMAEQDPAAVITQAALAGLDPLCQKTLNLFVSAYGAEAGNLALKSLPYGGVYIAGGIAPKILPSLQDGCFMDSFMDKGRLNTLLATLRVTIILNSKLGLIGAALYAHRLLKS